MRSALGILTIALAGLTPIANAQVFKCAGAGGKLVYSDQPCEGGASGAMLQRQKTWQEVSRERTVAAEAEQRKYRARSDEREQQVFEQQMRISGQQTAPSSAPRPQPQSETAACKAAKKELAFVSNIRTVSQDEKRMRTNSAISNVNAACGSTTQLMQEPANVRIINQHNGNSSRTFMDQNGRQCNVNGTFIQCH